MPITKYSRQIATARKTIVRKGTTCTWFKADNTNAADDPSPEFPQYDAPIPYPLTPIVFYPLKRQNLATILAVAITGSFTDQLFALIPGDVPFTPEKEDAVELTMPDGSKQTVHVEYVNITQPDLVPIVYELGFK